jgi:threonine 3-dehydrogenase
MPQKMHALVKSRGEFGIWLEQIDIPQIKPHEVLVKIKKTAICGTDLHIYKWDEWAQKTIPTPMQVGHEFVGEIVELGHDTPTNLKLGDLVSGEGHIVCGQCRACRAGTFHLCPNTKGIGVNIPGAFAQYLAIPAFNIFKIPAHINENIASMLDPFGNAVHTALTFDLVGEDVLITGAGPIGCIAIAICNKIGARNVVITDVNEYRLDLARKFGATMAVNVSDCKTSEDATTKIKNLMPQLGMKEGFDVGLEMSGIQTALDSMINNMINGGKIAALGISSKMFQVDWNKIVFKSLDIKGVYGREMFETWYKMSSLIKSGLDVDQIITHVLPIQDYKKGFELMLSGNCGKVILDWSSLDKTLFLILR